MLSCFIPCWQPGEAAKPEKSFSKPAKCLFTRVQAINFLCTSDGQDRSPGLTDDGTAMRREGDAAPKGVKCGLQFKKAKGRNHESLPLHCTDEEATWANVHATVSWWEGLGWRAGLWPMKGIHFGLCVNIRFRVRTTYSFVSTIQLKDLLVHLKNELTPELLVQISTYSTRSIILTSWASLTVVLGWG